MRNKIFSLIILSLLLIGFSILLLPQKKVSVSEKRRLKTNNSISLGYNFNNSVDEVLKDQFVFRDSVIKVYYSFNINYGKLVSRVSHNNLYSGKFGNIKLFRLMNDIYEIDNNYLISKIPKYDEQTINSAESRGYNINEFDLKYPEIQTYVYFPTQINEYMDDKNVDCTLARNAYLKQLNENIKYCGLEINSLEEYQKYYYKSEEHWNALGAYAGYCDIISMISKEYNIDSPKKIVNEIEYPYHFFGNISTKIGSYGEPDSITELELQDIKDFKYYINGEESDYFEQINIYKKEGNISEFSDFDFYYGNNWFIRSFDFNQPDKPNLLIFADSFINTNKMWIASHFNKTIIIDLRAKPDNFRLDDIINEFNINIALIVQSYNSMYLNGNMYIPME